MIWNWSTPGIVACDADRFDAGAQGNQTRESATVIMEGNQPGLRLCGSIRDEDWYRIDLNEESEITVNLTFSHNQGDLNMEIYSAMKSTPLFS